MKNHTHSKNILGALCAISLTVLTLTVNAAPPPGSWSLVWSDEFNGSSIDSSKWSWGSLPWGGQHHNDEYASWITPEDSYVSGGSLWLRCRKATGSEFGGYPYSEGFAHSNGKMNYTYGYAEIRARYPTGKGVWPAFWSLPSGWPPEFDIAEYFGSDNRMHMGLAYGTCCPASWNSSNFYNEGAQNWHTWGLEWGPGYAIWYKDGAVKKTIYASYVPTVPMYLILNSGMRWDADSTTPFPNYFQVDYVRLYTLPADPVPNGTYRIVNRNSGKALDVATTTAATTSAGPSPTSATINTRSSASKAPRPST
jgi:beta-glucanase (GH16 family)